MQRRHFLTMASALPFAAHLGRLQAAALQPKPRYTDPWDSVAQLSRLSQDRAGEAEAYERIIDILQTDWGLGECETVRGYRENLAQCRKAEG